MSHQHIFCSTWVQNQVDIDFKPMYYRRYVDDSFLMFKSEDQITLFQDYLNNKHPNIKFSCECENNRNLPFLDCLLTRKNDKFETFTYRKEIFFRISQ